MLFPEVTSSYHLRSQRRAHTYAEEASSTPEDAVLWNAATLSRHVLGRLVICVSSALQGLRGGVSSQTVDNEHPSHKGFWET